MKSFRITGGSAALALAALWTLSACGNTTLPEFAPPSPFDLAMQNARVLEAAGTGDLLGAAEQAARLADTLQRAGRLAQAGKTYRAAIRYARQGSGSYRAASYTVRMAAMYLRAGDVTRTRAALLSTRLIFKRLGDRRRVTAVNERINVLGRGRVSPESLLDLAATLAAVRDRPARSGSA